MPLQPERLAFIPAGLAVIGLVLPEPANVITFLASLGLGVGMMFAAAMSQINRARIKSFKEWDDAQRDSCMAKLQQTTAHLENKLDQLDENTRRMNDLEANLAEERKTNDRLRTQLTGFAMSVLHEKGFLAEIVPPPPEPPPPEEER
jgi:septal ring factor EnvC (AmiA/AmiB activator)